MKNLLFIVALMFSVSVAFADNGSKNEPTENNSSSTVATTSVNGLVVDLNSGESLAGAIVKIKGTDKVAYTDFDGNFTFENLKAGTYTLEITYISYKNSLVENMVVSTSKDNSIEIQLVPESN